MTNQTYHTTDISAQGSVSQLMTLINAPKKLDAKNIAGDFNEWNDTWLTVSDAYILAACLEFFGMSSLDSRPTRNIPMCMRDHPEPEKVEQSKEVDDEQNVEQVISGEGETKTEGEKKKVITQKRRTGNKRRRGYKKDKSEPQKDISVTPKRQNTPENALDFEEIAHRFFKEYVWTVPAGEVQGQSLPPDLEPGFLCRLCNNLFSSAANLREHGRKCLEAKLKVRIASPEVV
jgi:hypothetical protein